MSKMTLGDLIKGHTAVCEPLSATAVVFDGEIIGVVMQSSPQLTNNWTAFYGPELEKGEKTFEFATGAIIDILVQNEARRQWLEQIKKIKEAHPEGLTPQQFLKLLVEAEAEGGVAK